MWKRGGMIAICKHLCWGVDGKGIVSEWYTHLRSFFFFFFFGFADERDAAVFVPSQLYCSIHNHTNISGQAHITTQPPPPIPLLKMLCDICIHTCLHSLQPVSIYRRVGFVIHWSLQVLWSQNCTFKSLLCGIIKVISMYLNWEHLRLPAEPDLVMKTWSGPWQVFVSKSNSS